MLYRARVRWIARSGKSLPRCSCRCCVAWRGRIAYWSAEAGEGLEAAGEVEGAGANAQAGAAEGDAAGVETDAASEGPECTNSCFLAGTDVLLGDGKTEEAIEDIHVGQRVATDGGVANSADGKTEAADPNATNVNRNTWREVTVTAGDWEVQTLEPLSWIQAQHVSLQHPFLLSAITDVAEMGVSAGLVGTVDSISACPQIQGGPGRVVLTTVTHLNDYVFNLTLKNASGETETLGVTGYHRFYDETNGWTQTQNLQIGETLRGDHGDLTVVGLTRDVGAYRVYNITVEADHVYYVGELQTLTHNTCPNNGAGPQHGGTEHNDAIDDLIDDLPDGADNIRKNQTQVDINGDQVGNNRPDVQYDLDGSHYNVEVDNIPSNSSNHAVTIGNNDPASYIIQIVLGG